MNFTPTYSHFAKIYDAVMLHIRFIDWADFILDTYKQHIGSQPSNILDIGCGTGELLKNIPDSIEKFGMDFSEQMLQKARRKNPRASFWQKDFRTFSLPQTFDLVVATHDSVNYLPDLSALDSHLHNVYQILKPGGCYFFDVSSEYNLIHNFHNKVFTEKHEEIFLSWQNYYDRKNREILSTLSFRDNDGNEYIEQHKQRFFSNKEIKHCLQQANLSLLTMAYDYKSWSHYENAALIGFFCQKTENGNYKK